MTFRLTLPCLVGFALLAFIFRAVGAVQQPHAALAGFREGCISTNHPCWYGIIPGIQTPAEAAALLQHFGFAPPQANASGYLFNNDLFVRQEGATTCTVSLHVRDGVLRLVADDVPIQAISIDCSDWMLGDVLSQTGLPDVVQFCGITLVYKMGMQIYGAEALQPGLSPFNQNFQVNIFSDTIVEDNSTAAARWQGFMPCWRYEVLRMRQKGV